MDEFIILIIALYLFQSFVSKIILFQFFLNILQEKLHKINKIIKEIYQLYMNT